MKRSKQDRQTDGVGDLLLCVSLRDRLPALSPTPSHGSVASASASGGAVCSLSCQSGSSFSHSHGHYVCYNEHKTIFREIASSCLQNATRSL